MLTFLFWNLNRSDRIDLLCDLVAERQIDIVAIAEPHDSFEHTLSRLRVRVAESFQYPKTETSRIQVFNRDREHGMREVYGAANGRVTIRELQSSYSEIYVSVAHMPSKVNWDAADQWFEAAVLADEVRRVEEAAGHQRTILVGDLNMNPFEAGVASAKGLHAMMTRAIAAAGTRIVQEREYPFFYNPMWAHFGDRTDGLAGTFHYRHGGHVSYDWNMFDQVLVRPDLLPAFPNEVEIVSSISDTNLLTANGLPNTTVGSDHLPIIFRLDVL